MEELKKGPRLLICSPEFLGNSEVCDINMNLLKTSTDLPQIRDILLECRLTPVGTRPIVCIDECQVTCSVKISSPARVQKNAFSLALDYSQAPNY